MRGFAKRAIATIAALAVSFGLVVTTAPAAQAATPGLEATLLYNGNPVTDDTVLPENAALKLRVKYSGSATPPLAGTSHTFDFNSGNVVLPTTVPATTSAIDSFAWDGTELTVNFKEPWPDGVNQGVFDIDFNLKSADQTTIEDLSWELNGEESKVRIVIRNDGDEQENLSDTVDKVRVSPGNLNGYVRLDATTDAFSHIDDSIIGADIRYRLVIDVPAGETRDDFRIADALPSYLEYEAGSFTSQLTSWAGPDGWNRTVTTLNAGTTPAAFAPTIAADGHSFEGTFDFVGPQKLVIEYVASVPDEAARAALETALETAYNANNASYFVDLPNVASFGPDDTRDQDATIRIQGWTPGPNPGSQFSKDADWGAPSYEREFITDEDGTILNAALQPEPASITYSLRANLGVWDGSKPNFTLNRNVVIVDTLTPADLSWNTGDPAFLTVAEGTLALTAAGNCTVGQADFASTAPGSYCVSADGKTLMVNVGQSSGTNVLLNAKAQLTSVAELAENGESSIEGATRYIVPNRASFHYRAGDPHNADRAVYPVTLPSERTQGLKDDQAFRKGVPGGAVTVEKGESTTVPYTFTVNPSRTGIAAADIRIVDEVDPAFFDVAADASNVTVTGTYSGEDISAHLVKSVDADGNLVVQFSESGKTAVNALTQTGNLVIVVELPTVVFDENDGQTLDLYNRATLYGTGEDPKYWNDASSEATSYGDELEVQKTVYDRGAAQWTRTLQAAADANGELVQPVYVYKVELIARGSYGGIAILDVEDTLPDAVDFLGFVTEEDAPTAANPTSGPVSLEHGLQASYAGGQVVIEQASGVYPEGARASAYFAVEVTDGTLPIVNSIGKVNATIVPVGPASIDIEKWTVEPESTGPQYDGNGMLTNDTTETDPGYLGDFDSAPGKSLRAGEPQQINFTISNDGPDNLVDVRVSDTLVSGAGEIEGLVCVFPDDTTGTEWAGPFLPGERFDCTGTLPALQAGQTHSDTARVDAVGEVTGLEVFDEDDWNAHVKSFAVGDYVWIDSDRDGVQDADEQPLAGVTVELLNEQGEVVGTTETDARGRYRFDNLAAGTYQVRFTLTEEQGKRYRYTSLESGAAGSDSNAGVDAANRLVGTSKQFVLDESNTALTADADYEFFDIEATEGIDPTWDAGVIEMEYAVGDYVWIDTDKDGVQDPDEKPLAGVTVELLNEAGEVVATTKTDAQGRYLFDRLPAGTYQVRFTLTSEQARWYQFTKVGSGNDANDSDANATEQGQIGLSAKFVLGPENTALTFDYDREFWASEGVDPTWDAGVVVIDPEVPTEPTDPEDPKTPEEPKGGKDTPKEIAEGGAEIAGALSLAVLLLGAGAAVLLMKRRRQSEV